MLNSIVVVCMGLGLLFFLGTAVGLLRFPDFYTRMHAAGKGDTLSSVLLLLGLALYHLRHPSVDTVLVAMKILGIVLFIFIVSPTATHAIMDAGFEARVRHWVKREAGNEPGADEEHPPRSME